MCIITESSQESYVLNNGGLSRFPNPLKNAPGQCAPGDRDSQPAMSAESDEELYALPYAVFVRTNLQSHVLSRVLSSK
ncbi:hypothetical protein PG995_012044 [Apiospora arundinis]